MGGTLGCAARIAIYLALYSSLLSPGNHLGIAMAGTLLVNLLGALLLGVVAQLYQQHYMSSAMWLLIGVGGLGAFTTFSALTLDIFVAWQWGLWAVAVSYAVITLVGSVGAVALGYLGTGVLVGKAAVPR